MGGVTGPVKSSGEEESGPWKESDVTLPPLPQAKNLIEISLRNRTTSRFFVDGSSLTIGKDNVVRFPLVIRSSEGVDNTSYVGLKCRGREWKTYAIAEGRRWRPIADPQWKPLLVVSYNDYQGTLAEDYMCAASIFSPRPVGSREYILRTLRTPPQIDHETGRKVFTN
jgi:hypothetical protein